MKQQHQRCTLSLGILSITSSAQLHKCTIAHLHNCITVQLDNHTTAQLHNCTAAQLHFSCGFIQNVNNTIAQWDREHQFARVNVFKSSKGLIPLCQLLTCLRHGVNICVETFCYEVKICFSPSLSLLLRFLCRVDPLWIRHLPLKVFGKENLCFVSTVQTCSACSLFVPPRVSELSRPDKVRGSIGDQRPSEERRLGF